jgi:ketosteroid isomerase-like protein
MAARKKTTTAKRTAAPAKKAPAPKAAPAKKAIAAAKPAAAPAAAAKPAPKKAAAAPPKKDAAASAVEALAKKIVKATTGEPGRLHFDELYAPDCVSYESRGEPVVGLAGLEEKGKVWGQMQKRSTWTPLHVATAGNTILIEWSAEVELRDGRTVSLREVAVHNTKNGKIVEERYYYDPVIFDPPAVQAEAAPVEAPRPRRAAPPPPVENHGTPSIDPIDL